MKLTVDHVSKKIGKKLVLDDIFLEAELGDVVGLIGPNGAGKTTIMKIIGGMNPPTEGNVVYDSKDIREYCNKKEYPVGMLIEVPALYNNLSAYRNLLINATAKGMNKKYVKDICKKHLCEIGLGENMKTKAVKLSLGMKQRLGIAISIINNPQIVIWDEPINGLDPEGILYMRALIKRFSEENKIVIISSHILGELAQVCNKVYFINKGKLVSKVDVKKEKVDLEKIYIKVING